MVSNCARLMQRPIPWFWIVLALLVLLAPLPAARLLLDLLGGLTLTILLLPLLLGAAGLVAWRVLQSQLRTCSVCGFSAMGMEQCPACGSPYGLDAPDATAPEGSRGPREIDAGDVTIDVEVLDDR